MQKSIYRPVKRACSAKMSSRPSDRARRVRRGGWGRLTRTLIEAQSEGTDVNLCVETQPSASTDACDNGQLYKMLLGRLTALKHALCVYYMQSLIPGMASSKNERYRQMDLLLHHLVHFRCNDHKVTMCF